MGSHWSLPWWLRRRWRRASLATAGTASWADFGQRQGVGILGGLVQASDGNFYGTTENGRGLGTVYRLAPDGTMKVLHIFNGTDGEYPTSSLTIGPDGELYGFTVGGGAKNAGTAFKISIKGKFKVLHSFNAVEEGNYSYLGSMTVGPNGNLYGVMQEGGTYNQGTVFEMTANGKVTVLHQFGSVTADGAYPWGGMTLASDGNFYGTTVDGGANWQIGGSGTLYRISPSGDDYEILENFGGSDNKDPNGPGAAPIEGSDGFLYGTTGGGGEGYSGTVFRMAKDGAQYTTLHMFHYDPSMKAFDGSDPQARLLLANNGRLYGTTVYGGPHSDCGILFSLTTTGDAYAVPHEFCANAKDGANPNTELIQATDGALYGTTYTGGKGGGGTVYKYTLN